jgi:hypothetical protein
VIPRPNILDSVVPGAPITRVRLFERVKTVLPPHGYGVVDQIRIIEVGPDGKGPGTWTTHRRQTNDSSKWAQHDTGSYLLPFIPLRVMTFNADQPPLRDLADLNLVHFQSLSEHRALMRVARTSMLTATGLTAEERDRTFTISNDYMLKSTNKDAKFYFTEHTGAAAGASEADLRALEQRMEVMGLQPLVARTSNDTAAGKRINENRSDSLVHRWVRVAEKAAKHVVQDLAEFARQPVRVVVDIFDDFQAIRSNAEDNELLVTMGEKLLITPRTFLEEMQRRDVLADTLDIDAELDGLKAERDKLAESAAKVAEVTAARSASVSEMA